MRNGIRLYQMISVKESTTIVQVCLTEIAPDELAELFQNLHKRFEYGSNVACSLIEALSECYCNAEHWSTCRQILSIMADKVNCKDLMKWIPSLTKYGYNIARHHTLLHG